MLPAGVGAACLGGNGAPAEGARGRAWAGSNNVELACTPVDGSWLNSVESGGCLAGV